MRYIEIISGPQTLYIDEEELEAIIENPSVHRVPGQPQEIAGISYYMGELVVYYNPFEMHGTAQQVYRCGIILRGGTGYRGILSDTVGEGTNNEQELEQIIKGVWVKKHD